MCIMDGIKCLTCNVILRICRGDDSMRMDETMKKKKYIVRKEEQQGKIPEELQHTKGRKKELASETQP